MSCLMHHLQKQQHFETEEYWDPWEDVEPDDEKAPFDCHRAGAETNEQEEDSMSMMSMQEAADILHEMFPGKTVVVNHTYHSPCGELQWYYTANVYTVVDGAYSMDCGASMLPTVADCVNYIREQVESKCSVNQEAA